MITCQPDRSVKMADQSTEPVEFALPEAPYNCSLSRAAKEQFYLVRIDLCAD